jgi:hypothetical protein
VGPLYDFLLLLTAAFAGLILVLASLAKSIKC